MHGLLPQLLFGLLLITTSHATQYRISIPSINVTQTLGSSDNLYLALSSTIGSQSPVLNNGTWTLGTVKTNNTINRTDVYQDLTISNNTAGISIYFGMLAIDSTGDKLKEALLHLGESVGTSLSNSILGKLTPFFSIGTQIIQAIDDAFNCDGPVAGGTLSFSADDLNGLTQQGQQLCRSTSNPVVNDAKITCSTPTYNVTYCVQRMSGNAGSTSGAGVMKTGVLGSLVGITTVMNFVF